MAELTELQKWQAIAKRHPDARARAKAEAKVHELQSTVSVEGEAGFEAPPKLETGAMATPEAGEQSAMSYLEGAFPGVTSFMASRRALDPSNPSERQMLLGMISPGGVWPWTQLRPGVKADEPPEVMSETEKQRNVSVAKSRFREGDEENPVTSTVSGFVGAGTGPLAKGMKLAAPFTKAIPWLGTPATGRLSTLAKGAGRGVLSYEATAPLEAGLSDMNEVGGTQAALDAATNPIGIALSAGAGVAGAKGERKVARLTDPDEYSGRIIKDIEGGGGKIKAFGDEPVAGGIFERPAMKELAHGRKGVKDLTYKTGKMFTQYNRRELDQARKAYDEGLQQVLSASGDKRIAPMNVIERVKQLKADNVTAQGTVLDDTLQGILDKIENESLSPDGVPVMDLIKIKKWADAGAEHGMPRTKDNRPYRMLLGAIAADAETIDRHRMKPLNKEFNERMTALERANDVVYGQDKTDIADRAASERRAGAAFGRVGDQTEAGTNITPQLEELEKVNPTYKALVRQVRGKKAQEQIRPDVPSANQVPIETSLEKGSRTDRARGLSPRDKMIEDIRIGLPMSRMFLDYMPNVQTGVSAAPIFMTEFDENLAKAESARRGSKNRKIDAERRKKKQD